MNKNKVTYKVFPEQGIVTAEISGCWYDAINIINERFMPNVTSALRIDLNNDNERFFMPKKFKAVAKCHPDDKFDEEVGKRVALNKLTDIYHRSLNTHLVNFMEAFYDCHLEIDSYLIKRV